MLSLGVRERQGNGTCVTQGMAKEKQELGQSVGGGAVGQGASPQFKANLSSSQLLFGICPSSTFVSDLGQCLCPSPSRDQPLLPRPAGLRADTGPSYASGCLWREEGVTA